jgi:hypothetical protein
MLSALRVKSTAQISMVAPLGLRFVGELKVRARVAGDFLFKLKTVTAYTVKMGFQLVARA